MGRTKRNRSMIAIYIATLMIIAIIILFIYTGMTVYINSTQVAFNTDISIFESIKGDANTLAMQIMGRRIIIDISPINNALSHMEDYYSFAPSSVKVGIPIITKLKELWIIIYEKVIM